ncbi:hypothetical protein [Kineococcus aurantiacus]|uniref:Uncharacterized protein n=1 Tax=Kineococcus aurantiacus TaxID=37633 RepID=A0A7Y9DK46_9ACTN|nr:hypothetical protein [Kineococcus aurantiacus]NYD22063.1 hypothetical protein [Kineococcus aurantiacus]
MSGPAVVVLPLTLFLLAGSVVGLVLLARRVPSAELTVPVVRARRRGAAVAGLAVVLAVALPLLAVSALGTGLRQGQLIAVAPLAGAAVHAAVLLVGELSWPRPAQRVRSARLAVRTVRQDAPRGMVVLFLLSCGLLWATCLAGTVLSDDSGRAISAPGGGGSASPFPGPFYAAPTALAAALAAALTWWVLLRVPRRPAVAGADARTDGSLRRAAAHRALRFSTAAVLGTTGALLFLGGTTAHGVGGRSGVQVGGTTVWTDAVGPVWNGFAAGFAVLGGLLALLALAVLLVPARGVGRPEVAR